MRSSAEIENPLHTPEYVEARAILVPAVEYFKRAVDTARCQGKLNGQLLAMVGRSGQLYCMTNNLYRQPKHI
jgi:hypothetical protein